MNATAKDISPFAPLKDDFLIVMPPGIEIVLTEKGLVTELRNHN